MSHETELLTEIRDLLQVIAEPALSKRDAKLRAALRAAVGKSAKRAKAVLLMDGTRSQSALAKESETDQGDLSRLVKKLATEHLVSADQKHPKILVKVPASFFDEGYVDEQ